VATNSNQFLCCEEVKFKGRAIFLSHIDRGCYWECSDWSLKRKFNSSVSVPVEMSFRNGGCNQTWSILKVVARRALIAWHQ
jgi:hypothetical protein